MARAHLLPTAGHAVLHVPAPLPVEAYLTGRTIDEVASLLPRLFNICPAAQRMAAHLALGRPVDAELHAALALEVMRDHLIKLAIEWPGVFGLPAHPAAMIAPPQDAFRHLFGPAKLPDTWQDLVMTQQRALRPGICLLWEISDTFQDYVTIDARHVDCAAARWNSHPLLQDVERLYGRGPLWRAMGRVVELEGLGAGWQPRAYLDGGTANVDAARGRYTCRADVRDGRVTTIVRVTPTDLMLAPEGALPQAARQVTSAVQAARLVPLFDPCVPVTLSWEPDDA